MDKRVGASTGREKSVPRSLELMALVPVVLVQHLLLLWHCISDVDSIFQSVLFILLFILVWNLKKKNYDFFITCTSRKMSVTWFTRGYHPYSLTNALYRKLLSIFHNIFIFKNLSTLSIKKIRWKWKLIVSTSIHAIFNLYLICLFWTFYRIWGVDLYLWLSVYKNSSPRFFVSSSLLSMHEQSALGIFTHTGDLCGEVPCASVVVIRTKRQPVSPVWLHDKQ